MPRPKGPAEACASTLAVEWWPIDRPKPYPKNARKLSARAIETVARSIRAFGWRQPIVVDKHDVIVAGHTRLLGELAYEPFLGSGTTLIAAEMTERVCYGVEIDPQYIDVVIDRWQQYTGAEATLDGDGRTFAAIKASRLNSTDITAAPRRKRAV